MFKYMTMNKKILNILAVATISLLSLNSCDKETEGLTRITVYPTIELVGGDVVVDKGTAYVEPGYTSMMGAEDVTSGVQVFSNVDTENSGVYSITYSTVLNEDGFGATATRTVVVLDPNDPVEGFYAVTPDSYRDMGGAIAEFGSPFEILILGEGDGVYHVDDLVAGWYCQRAAYGTDYAMEAEIQIDGSDVSLLGSYVPGWGDTADDFHDASYDAATNTFKYAVDYAGSMTFYITLVKE